GRVKGGARDEDGSGGDADRGARGVCLLSEWIREIEAGVGESGADAEGGRDGEELEQRGEAAGDGGGDGRALSVRRRRPGKVGDVAATHKGAARLRRRALQRKAA